MSAAEDLDVTAGEYVLGTLDPDERAAFAGLLARDDAARHAVEGWDRRLAPLLDTAPAVPPPPAVWSAIEGALAASAAPSPRSHADARTRAAPHLVRSRNRWRAAALAASGIAAGLAVLSLVGLRERAAMRSDTFVAAVNRGGAQPALIVTVDLATRTVLVQPVAAQAPAGHSLQLWYIGDGRPPLSMGLVPDARQTTAMPAGASTEGGGMIAVSLEPPGGSRTDGPSGAVLYSGQLVKE